jgi:chromosome segregation ATPase
MTTAHKSAPSIRETEKNALVLRLERTQLDLQQLRGQLDSYRCEPRTYGLFETIESLRRGMDRLSRSNLETIETLREQKKTVEDYFEKAKHQFLEFNQLQSRVEDYRTKCLGY